VKYTCTVIKGKGRGKSLGFPTFNLQIPKNFKLKSGIYAAWVWINNQKYQGALHFGPIPAFNNPTSSLEIFVLNFDSNSPINQLSFKTTSYLRPIKNFTSLASLKTQISTDVTRVKKILSI